MIDHPIFRSAITGTDGLVDAGYLGLFAVMLMVLGMIPFALALTAIHMFISPDHALDLVGVAAIIASAGAAFGTAAAGVGMFRMGDKTHASPPPAAQ
jgi:hypothetical protein